MPLLSVIIPTHNRAKYALPTIQAMLELSPDIEVVVSDTSANDDLASALQPFASNERLVMVRPPTGISVVDNFNTALNKASGDYLTFITRPISGTILAIALVALIAPPIIRRWRARLDQSVFG